jgi:hypothetical protein
VSHATTASLWIAIGGLACRFEPGSISTDASAPVDGPNAPADAPADGSSSADAGLADAPIVDARMLDGAYPCSLCGTVGGTCDPSGICEIIETDQGPVTIDCPPGHYCHVTCEADGCQYGLTCTGDVCHIDCDGANACQEDLDCRAATCVVDCRGANSCETNLDCSQSTSCICCLRESTCSASCPSGGCDPGPSCDG